MVAPLTLDPGLRKDPYTPFTGFEGISTGQPMLDLVVQMFGGSFLDRMQQAPLGLSPKNLYDRMQNLSLQRTHDELLRKASERDRYTYYDALRGYAAMAGTPWGAPQVEAAQGLAETMAYAGPTAAQLLPPMVLDALGGYRGLNVVMADQMFQGSRLRIDPTTGRSGMSGPQTERLSNDMYAWLSSPAGRKVGLSAGEMGMAFSELQRMGAIPGGLVGLDQLSPNLIRQSAQDLGIDTRNWRSVKAGLQQLAPEQLRALRESPDVSAAVESFDSQRVISAMQKYQGVVKGLREIFGDAGYTNAPVAELLNSLNQLTGGAVTQISPGQAESMVRTTYNLAKASGVGLEGAMVYSQLANQQADAFGLPTIFGGQLLQSAMAFRAAYTGMGAGSEPMWGLSSQEELAGFDMQRRAAATQSQMANQMGAALRLADRLGEGRPAFRAGSAAANYVEAVRNGATRFETAPGQFRDIADVDEAEFFDIMRQGADFPLSDAALTQFLSQRSANQEAIHKYSLGDYVRRTAQPVEFQRYLAGQIESAAVVGLEGITGPQITPEVRRTLGTTISDAYTRQLGQLSGQEIADPATRQRLLADAVERELRSIARGQTQVDGLSPGVAAQTRNRFLTDDNFRQSLMETLWGSAEEASRDPASPFGPGRSLADNLAMDRPELQRQIERARAVADSKTMQQQAFAPLGRDGFMRRGIEAVINSDETDPDVLTRVLTTAIGGEDQGRLGEVLGAAGPDGEASLLSRLKAKADAFEALSKKYEADSSPKNRAMLDAAAAGYRETVSSAVSAARRAGINPGTAGISSSAKQLEEALRLSDKSARDTDITPEALNRRISGEQNRLRDFLSSVYGDPDSLSHLGSGGLAQLQQLQSSAEALDRMALDHTGGDLGKLFRGADLNEEQKTRMAALRKQQLDSLSAVKSLLRAPQAPLDYLTPDLAEPLKRAVETLGGTPFGRAQGIETIQDLIGLSETAMKQLSTSGLLPEADLDAVTKARGLRKKSQTAAERQRDDYFQSSEQLLREAYRRSRGLGDDAEIDDAAVEAWYGGEKDYKKALELLSGTDLDSERRRRSVRGMVRGDTLDDFAKEKKIDFDSESGFGAGEIRDLLREAGRPSLKEDTTGSLDAVSQETRVSVHADTLNITVNGDGGAELDFAGDGQLRRS